ncbi:50S ribosomal protein L22 [Candidatus Omnitrophota bacterium]
MIGKAKHKYLRVSPRKVNLVMELIRGRSVDSALSMLAHLNKAVSHHVNKLLRSALSNAQNKGADTADLSQIYVSKATADSGPTLKRFKAAAFGRATTIQKKTSHLLIELDSKAVPVGVKPARKREKPAAKATKAIPVKTAKTKVQPKKEKLRKVKAKK